MENLVVAEKGSEDEDSLTALKQQLQIQLEQSGISKTIKKFVEEIYKSKDDPCPEDVFQAIYNRGIVSSVLQKFDERLHLQPQNHKETENNFCHSNPHLDKEFIHSSQKNQFFELNLEPEKENSTAVCGRRYYLKVDILDGKAFMDHLSHETKSSTENFRTTCKMKLVLHVFYKSQRFVTQQVDCCCDPYFKDVFMIDIGYFQNGSVAELMKLQEPLRIIVVRENVNEDHSIISYTEHNWRSILVTENGTESFTIDLMGIGPEHSIPVGLLNANFTLLPLPDELLSESSFLSKLQNEKTTQEEQTRNFRSSIKQWRKHFLDIRPIHKLRNLRLFAFDEKMVSRFVTTFIEPLNCHWVFLTPFHAAWFTSMIKLNKCDLNSSLTEDNVSECWQSLETTIASKQGDVVDHAILLCSQFLGLGLDAYVALGSKKGKGKWSWTITFDNACQPLFWESTTGKRYKHALQPETAELPVERIDRVKLNDRHRFHSIGCLFSHESYYVNIQSTDSVNLISWNIMDPSKWKSIPTKVLNSIHTTTRNIIFRNFSLNNYTALSQTIEMELKQFLSEARTRVNLQTLWDDRICKIMGQQLATKELEASTGGSEFENFFESAVMKYLPSGFDFKGFQFHTCSTNTKNIFHSCMMENKCQDVVYCRGDDIKFSIRVMIFPYPENILSIRLIIGSMFLPTD